MLQPGGDPDLLEEAVRAERGDQLAAEDLERDRPVVPEILRQPHRRHPAPAELALDAVAVGQGSGEEVDGGESRSGGHPGTQVPAAEGGGERVRHDGGASGRELGADSARLKSAAARADGRRGRVAQLKSSGPGGRPSR